MQPPTQELVVRDLHDNTWTFRHIYRGEEAFDNPFVPLTSVIFFLNEDLVFRNMNACSVINLAKVMFFNSQFLLILA